MQREFAILIRKNGKRIVKDFPATLKPGESLVAAIDVGRVEAPAGSKWTIYDYQVSGNTCRWNINTGKEGGKG